MKLDSKKSNSEKAMTKEQAKKIYNTVVEETIRHYNHYKDQVEKAFILMLHKLRKEKEFYENNKILGISVNGQDEIVKIITSHITEIENQLDIITNGAMADVFQFKLTAEKIKNNDVSYTGFNGGLVI